MSNDLTFITNDEAGNLRDRFATLIKATQFFDVLVGYFYTSGFHAMYPSLESTDRIRILIGISTNRETFDLIQRVKSHKEVRDQFSLSVKEEMELSENELHVEIGVKKFLEWLKSGKLEIRAYPEEKIHSKLYVMSFKDGQMDMGRVITGSSNFTQNGLVENLEFNVELKNRSDYEFARDKFEELWARGVDVSDKYVETIQKDTWLREDISDLLAQIKLFQKTRQSTIPNLPDVEGFFKSLDRKLKGLDRQADKEAFITVTKENAALIRDRVLKHLMVRRTRKEISEYYGDDLCQQGMSFPEVAEPQPIFYEFNPEEDRIFFRTIELVTQDFMYARYTPMLHHKGSMSALERQSQQNMMKFMKMLLIKRLESSFFAFTQTLDRFIASYDHFIEEFEDGTVYVSAKHTQKIFELLERGDLDAIDRLIEEGKAERFPAEEFDDKLKANLYADRHILQKIKDMWKTVKRDPKILAFKEALKLQAPIHDGKSIIFTESKETADYLQAQLQSEFSGQIVCFTGSSSSADREEVIANFDASAKNPKDDYKLLITTDVLAEGANLHRANVVINYDIPWNPTRIMQRVGRINRVDTKHEQVYTYTFFPTDQSNDQIKLKEAAEAKIAAFISLLGADARLLTESEEVEAHSLFSQLLSKETIEGEDEPESELKYLQEIRLIRDDMNRPGSVGDL